MKIEMMRPKPMIKPQTFGLLQGYVVPPHCNASSRHTIAVIRKKAPKKSILFNFCLTVSVKGPRRFGGVKNSATARNAQAPKGKLIFQKSESSKSW